jgi:hypothetical protein
VRRLARTYCDRLVALTRRDNAEALQVLGEAGIELIPPTREQVASFRKSAEKNYRTSIPSLYSEELFDRVRGLIDDHRKTEK